MLPARSGPTERNTIITSSQRASHDEHLAGEEAHLESQIVAFLGNFCNDGQRVTANFSDGESTAMSNGIQVLGPVRIAVFVAVGDFKPALFPADLPRGIQCAHIQNRLFGPPLSFP